MTDRFDINLDTLTQAVLCWTGYRTSASPLRQDAAITDAYPPADAGRLITLIQNLEEDFYRSDAHAHAFNLSEMGAAASTRFGRLYPDLPAIVTDAFAWCYTFAALQDTGWRSASQNDA